MLLWVHSSWFMFLPHPHEWWSLIVSINVSISSWDCVFIYRDAQCLYWEFWWAQSCSWSLHLASTWLYWALRNECIERRQLLSDYYDENECQLSWVTLIYGLRVLWYHHEFSCWAETRKIGLTESLGTCFYWCFYYV